MNESQQKAWDCLTKIEQQSLFLHTSEGKSSWEAGSMLNISHYKYIEIRERSEKFFRLFGDYFSKWPSLFRPDCPCERNFQDFIEGVIEHRLKRREAMVYTGDSTQQLPKVSNENITRNMKLLKMTEDEWDKDVRALILEFDRWNNFRVLPIMLQQPSAFKRRLNKKDKIYIKYLLNRIPEFVLEKLKERFYYKAYSGKKKYWVALISPNLYTDGYYLLPIRTEGEVIQEMNRFYIYVFEDREDADTFGYLVTAFYERTSKVMLGQKFWPEFRFIVRRAINFNQVNNLDFNVNTLDNAYDLKPKKKSKKKKVFKDNGVTPISDPLIFYKK